MEPNCFAVIRSDILWHTSRNSAKSLWYTI